MTNHPLPDGAIEAIAHPEDAGLLTYYGPKLSTARAKVTAAGTQTTGGDLILRGDDAPHVLIDAEESLTPDQAREFAHQVLAAADLADRWAILAAAATPDEPFDGLR